MAQKETISKEEEKRLNDLFNKIDINKDGQIDMHDLNQAMSKMQVQQLPSHAKEFFEKHDSDHDGLIDFKEFVKYVKEHEKRLRLFFGTLDTNKDGAIDAQEICESFRKIGVNMDEDEARNLLKRMDKDGTLKIDWDEWKEFHLLQPSVGNLADLLHNWRHSTIIDVGDNTIVPDDFTEEELKTGIWWRNLMAGGAAGAVSRTCTAPLDRIKVMLQVHGTSKNQYGVISAFKHMLKEGGVKSMWRGNGINVLKIAPESAIKFMAYENYKKMIHGDSKSDLQVWERLVSGSLAGATAQTIIYPGEVLKTRLALRKTGQYSGIVDCARKVYQQEGLKVFYRGYVPNILGIIPYAGIDLAVYETIKRNYMMRYENSDPGIMVLLACATISSTCGQLASYPLALIRTRLQAQDSALHSRFKTRHHVRTIREDCQTGWCYRTLPWYRPKLSQSNTSRGDKLRHIRKNEEGIGPVFFVTLVIVVPAEISLSCDGRIHTHIAIYY